MEEFCLQHVKSFIMRAQFDAYWGPLPFKYAYHLKAICIDDVLIFLQSCFVMLRAISNGLTEGSPGIFARLQPSYVQHFFFNFYLILFVYLFFNFLQPKIC